MDDNVETVLFVFVKLYEMVSAAQGSQTMDRFLFIYMMPASQFPECEHLRGIYEAFS
mgnify:CR=1 FL=1